VAAGRVSHEQLVKLARRYGKQLKQGIPVSATPASSKQTAPQLALVHKRTEQTQLALGIRTCSRHDPRRYALRLLNTILGENMSSRLFQIIREDRGLAYSIFSSPSFFADTGDLVISAGLETSNAGEALGLIIRELRTLAKKAPSPGELRRARDYIFGQIDLGSESTENQMNWLGEQLLGYGKIFSPATVKKRLEKVTASEIRAVAAEFFRPENLTLALVSPLKSARHLEKRLRF
jgi:predicted Zn-dependent peptidase